MMSLKLEKFKLALAFRLHAQTIAKQKKRGSALKKQMMTKTVQDKKVEEAEEGGGGVEKGVEEVKTVTFLISKKAGHSDHSPGSLAVRSHGIPTDLHLKSIHPQSSSLEGQLILPTRRRQKELLSQIWSILTPGGKFCILAIIPIKRHITFSKDTLLHGFGKEKVISDLKKWADRVSLEMSVREEKVFLTTDVWLEIFRILQEHVDSWHTLLNSSTLDDQSDPATVANVLASKIDQIVVTLTGSKREKRL